MSGVRFHTPRFRLSEQLREAGGKTVADAVQDAGAGLESIAAACLAALDKALVELERDIAALPAKFDETAMGALYHKVNDMIGVAGAAGLPDMDRAAYSLCDLIDSMRVGQRVGADAISVHLQALQLLRRPDALGGEAAVKQILGGLSRVRQKYAPPKAASPA